jgi:signal transduction histidine kinase
MTVNPHAMDALSDEQFRAIGFDLVSRMADDLAHEIKNPLNAIVINLEVLKVRIARSDASAALERVAVVEHEARRLHDLIDRLLLLLRPDREEASTFALDRVLDEIHPLIEAQARLARNRFEQDCTASVFLACRRDVLKFVILTLVTALNDRLGDGGGTIAFACEPADRHVRIRISGVPDAPPLAPRDRAWDRSIKIAEALLVSCAGRLEDGSDFVGVVLPRAAPL